MGIATAIGRKGNWDCVVTQTCFDGWVEGDTAPFGIASNTVINGSSSDTATYGYRSPLMSDGSRYPDNWYQDGTVIPGASQAVADDEIIRVSDAGIGARQYLWYPPNAILVSGGPFSVSAIYDAGISRYLTSPNIGLLKFTLVLQSACASADASGFTTGTWLNFTPAFLPHWLSLIANAQYLFLPGTNRPVIGIYQNAGATQWDATHITALRNAVTGAGFGNPFLVGHNTSAANANALGLDGITTYGPNPVPPGSGQEAYAALAQHDKDLWSIAGSNQERVLPVTTRLDTRPRAYAQWFDDPVYTEFEQRICRDLAMAKTSRSLCAHSMTAGYSLNELDEGGGSWARPIDILFSPNTPPRGLILDAYRNVMLGYFPKTGFDAYHCASLQAVWTRGGAGWAIVQNLVGTGGVTGAFLYSELQSTTAGNTLVWTPPYNVTRVQLFGRNFAGGGTFNVHLDANPDTLINQNAGGTTNRVQLFDSGVVAAGVHPLTMTVVTGCSVNYVLATFAR